jgi:transposase-like protein
MRGMKSSQQYKLVGQVEVDETIVGGQEEGVVGRKNGKKKIVVIAAERKGKGISRLYGKVVEHSNSKELGNFMKKTIDSDAFIKTDEWRGYTPLKSVFKHLRQVPSGKKGENFPDLHRVIMNFKGWLRGMHHHVEHLQAYIDEYTYRFNRSFMKGNIFDNLIMRMLQAKPYTYKMIIT